MKNQFNHPHFLPYLRPAISLVIGIASSLLCYSVLTRTTGNAGDLGWALRAAGDFLNGHDVYLRPFGDDRVPYPLPAIFLAIPLLPFPPSIAGSIFVGLSSMLLAWCLLRQHQYWWLMVFLSWPYIYGLIFVQWTPLIVCLAFLGPLLPLLLIKPQVAIPLLVLHPFSRWGVLSFLLVGLVSLAIYPTWPLVWLGQIGGYRGTLPPLLALPLGPLLLLALIRFRDRYTWFFLLAALMPQRVVYDQLALLLIARTWRDLLVLVVCSWITLPALLLFGGWTGLPGGWRNWIVITLYIPALVILLRRNRPIVGS
jgi:hypothetical protein